MDNFTLHYELKGRMSADGEWYVIGFAASKEILDAMMEKQKATWRYLAWNSYSAAPRLK